MNLTITIVSLMVIALGAALLGFYFNHPEGIVTRANSNTLAPGRYRGLVNGLGAEGAPLTLVVEKGRTMVQVELPGCGLQEISSENSFACSGRTFMLSVNTADQFGALGVIEEPARGLKGRWSVSRE